jgi:hypothetical protein
MKFYDDDLKKCQKNNNGHDNGVYVNGYNGTNSTVDDD